MKANPHIQHKPNPQPKITVSNGVQLNERHAAPVWHHRDQEVHLLDRHYASYWSDNISTMKL